MVKKKGKRYLEAQKLIEENKSYGFEEAVDLLKRFPLPKFDPTVILSFRLGVDPKKNDQMVRGSLVLPHGSGKKVRIVVFATGQAETEAKKAGVDYVGFKDLIAKVLDGFTDFDVAVATPETMIEVRKVAKVLGPRGLMPNPKTGTVTDNVVKTIEELKAGKVDYKLDKNGNIALPIGKASFEVVALIENGKSLIENLQKAKPTTAKGIFIKSGTLSSTMSPGIALNTEVYQPHLTI